MPAPRKYPPELRERSIRLVREAMKDDPSLSMNQAVIRIGQRVGVNPDTLRGWTKQNRIDAGEVPGRPLVMRRGSGSSSRRSANSNGPTRF